LGFSIAQHVRDERLMKNFIEYLNCGNVYFSKQAVYFRVDKFTDLETKIILFFVKYPILGVKAEDLKDFCQVAELMKENKHLTPEGLYQIRKIKAGMNKGRST
jgi:hypothetical protein